MEIPTRLFNTALMVAPQAVDEIIMAKVEGSSSLNGLSKIYAKSPEGGKTYALLHDREGVEYENETYAITDGVAVIEITGGLTYRAYNWWVTSYLDIRDSFRAAMADERVNSVLLLIDSPGGEVAGLFDLVDEIYHARGTKPIIAVADEAAFSAAYAIASAADEVYLPTTAQAGSIGVIAIHVEQSGYDKSLGVHYTTIFAGERKNDFNPHEPLNPEGKATLQANIEKLYDMLTAIIARNRSMSQAAVIATQAGFYMGDEAVKAGLADGILPVKDVMTRMSSSKGDMVMNLNEVKDFINQALAESMAEVKTILDGLEARLTGTEPVIEPPATTELDRETPNAMAADIVEICNAAGMPELAGAMIRDGLTLDEAKSAVLDAKAKAADEVNIRSTVGPLTSGEINPLLADAKKRAEKQGAGNR